MQTAETMGSILIKSSIRDTVSGDGAVLLDIERGLCFTMNPVGARIWEMLKVGSSRELITATLVEEFEVPESQVEKDIVEFMQALEAMGLIISAPPPKKERALAQLWFWRRPS
jgi:hypothetical protein